MGLKSKPLAAVRHLPIDDVAQIAEQLVRINLNVPKNTRSAWKIAALRKDITLTQLIIEAMTSHLK